jgi:HPt (histidine-containing phosphotransfer) domain-containing protein
MLVGYLRRNGCRVHGTHDPREATRSAADDYDLVVLSTEIPDADPLDVVRYLQEDRPEQWVVLAGQGTLDAELRSAGVREVLPVPGGLSRLGDLVDLLRGDLALRDSTHVDDPDAVDVTVLEALRAEDPLVVQETVEIFLGQTPEALARIAEGQADGDAKTVQTECRTLATSARALGANHLARLAQAAAELARDGDLEHVPGFVHEMEREYGLVFRALMNVHAASTRKAHGRIR